MNQLNFTRISLTVITICSIGTFAGVFKLLHVQHKVFKKKVLDDFLLAKRMIRVDQKCQDRLTILEEDVALLKLKSNYE